MRELQRVLGDKRVIIVFVLILIINGITVLIIYNGSHAVDNGTMQVGNMMAFMQYAMQIIMSFLMITMMSIMLPRASVSAKRINEIMETKVSIESPETAKIPENNKKGESLWKQQLSGSH